MLALKLLTYALVNQMKWFNGDKSRGSAAFVALHVSVNKYKHSFQLQQPCHLPPQPYNNPMSHDSSPTSPYLAFPESGSHNPNDWFL